jgi:hypothetical protein
MLVWQAPSRVCNELKVRGDYGECTEYVKKRYPVHHGVLVVTGDGQRIKAFLTAFRFSSHYSPGIIRVSKRVLSSIYDCFAGSKSLKAAGSCSCGGALLFIVSERVSEVTRNRRGRISCLGAFQKPNRIANHVVKEVTL